MIIWESPDGISDPRPYVFCDCCGQQCNIWKNGKWIGCSEISGKEIGEGDTEGTIICSECSLQNFAESL